MRRGLNQLNLPDWFEKAHWRTEVVCMEFPYVEGELTLFPNGDARIGMQVFSGSVPIDNWQFAGGYVAKRRFDRPEWLVIRTPAGKHNYYRYRSLLGAWEQYVPFNDPVLDQCVAVYGPALGSGVFELKRAVAGFTRLIVGLLCGALCLGFGVLGVIATGMAVRYILLLFE